MKELLCFLKLLVITDKLVRCLKCAVKILICAMTILAAIDSAKLIGGMLQNNKRKHKR